MNIIIRKAKLKDLDDLYNLEKMWENEEVSWGIYIIPTRKSEIKKELRTQIWYVAELDNKIIGYANGVITKTKTIAPVLGLKKGQKFGEINSMYILKNYRGKDIGKLLLEKLLEEFKENKIKVVKLISVSKDVQGLVNYYKRFGFEERTVNMVLKLK